MYLCEAFRRIRQTETPIVEVFKTNVDTTEIASQLLKGLQLQFPAFKINFDLDDCDHILRVAGRRIDNDDILDYL
ncbi:MAG: hypothetical protein M3R25_04195, partial [Bacteroidota bacterium]|nr:hypothetical protein [Bacteroidota bacterium]